MANSEVLSFNTRKCFCVHLGERAGNELADLLMRLVERVDGLEKDKVDVMHIVPGRNLQMARLHEP